MLCEKRKKYQADHYVFWEECLLGRVGIRATQAGQGQAITKPWKANTEAETVGKLVKQYWEEHDTEISVRSKEGHPE